MNEAVADNRRPVPAAPCELRQGRYGLFTVRLAQFDPGAIQAHLSDRVASAPALLENAPVVLDPNGLAALPSQEQAQDLLARLRAAGLRPLATAQGPEADAEMLSQLFGLPLIAAEHARRPDKIDRAGSEPTPAVADPMVDSAPEKQAGTDTQQAAPADQSAGDASPSPRAGSLYVHSPVRSGQQIYAKGRDLVITAAVSAGAEVIADGCIHVYARLAGKALAGARGDESARIYSLNFQPELVSIAGQYRLIESVPETLRGQAVEVILDNERLDIRPLGTR